jgi:inorganic pyrophosphatase
MKNLATLPNEWKRKRCQCRAIIETPKGGRNKFDYDPETGIFELGGLLPEGLSFPFDFGFIPSTLGGDGDPLDVLVLMEEPAHVGCLLHVRLIGVIEARQAEAGKAFRNDRLVAVAIHSYQHGEVARLDQLPTAVLDQLDEFFTSYNKSRGKKFKVLSRKGPKGAARVLDAAIGRFEKR